MAKGSCGAGPRGPRHLRGLRAVPPALSDVQADGRGTAIASRQDRGHADHSRRARAGRHHVRGVHGCLPRLSSVRGRLPLACPVRPHDGGGPRAGGTAQVPAITAGAVDRFPLGADPPVDGEGRGRTDPGGPAVHAQAPPHAPAEASPPVRAAPECVGTAGGGRGSRNGRAPRGVRPGSMVPPGEPGHDPRVDARGVAGDGAAVTGLLWRAGGAQRPADRRATTGNASRRTRSATPTSSS